MAYFSQEKKQPTVNVFSGITFTNPDSPIMQTRLSISYFNKMMCLTFEPRDYINTVREYPTYNKDLGVKTYLSNTKAKLLLEAMKDMFNNPNSNKTNVGVEVNSGVLKVSNGAEYGANSPCIALLYVKSTGDKGEIIYHTKVNYEAVYNFNDSTFTKFSYPNFEIETFMMALEQYYLASSYAIAASIAESNMYRENSHYELLRSIADKVGAGNNGGYNKGSKVYASKSFFVGKTELSPEDDYNSNNQQVPEEYSAQSFDEMVDSLSSGSLLDDNNSDLNVESF